MLSFTDSVVSFTSITLGLGVILVGFILQKSIILWILSTSRGCYPPGPKPKFIIGNMFDFPMVDAAQHYVEWEKKYSSNILHASTLGNHVIVLNSLSDAEELLERRANIYSDRMELPIIKLLSLDGNMAFMPQSEQWRRHRRLAQQYFRLDTVSDHHPVQLRRTHVMLKGLLESPQDFMLHIKTLAISIPLASMYGYDVASNLNNPFVTGTERVLEIGDPLLGPLSTLVNIIPALGKIPAWIPGATTQRLALEHRNIIKNLKTEPLRILKKAVDQGTAAPCVLSRFMEERSGQLGYEEEKEIITSLSVTIYAGTSGTTTSALGTLISILARHPKIQRTAQEEIDRVVGRERLPDFQDRPSMPYTDALYHELMRWRPPAMLNIPHCVRADDHYKGYFIPKGSLVVANIWAMTRDETIYNDPHTFEPERFLDKEGNLTGNRRILAYGFGRFVSEDTSPVPRCGSSSSPFCPAFKLQRIEMNQGDTGRLRGHWLGLPKGSLSVPDSPPL